MIINCENCTKSFYKKPANIKKYRTHFCSIKCFSEKRNKQTKKKCFNCRKEIMVKRLELKERNFCSRSCATVYNNKTIRSGEKNPNYTNGKGSYRNRAFRYYGAKCSNNKCIIGKKGIKVPKKMLDVDHIDCNRENNKLENLQVLCVWCHALKTRKIKK